jgi:hypothetical protein
LSAPQGDRDRAQHSSKQLKPLFLSSQEISKRYSKICSIKRVPAKLLPLFELYFPKLMLHPGTGKPIYMKMRAALRGTSIA